MVLKMFRPFVSKTWGELLSAPFFVRNPPRTPPGLGRDTVVDWNFCFLATPCRRVSPPRGQHQFRGGIFGCRILAALGGVFPSPPLLSKTKRLSKRRRD
ncbi:hypothetical protein TNCV_1572661 [Trichonephila clavipes]|uniref:Uncharacterized protein n=1 Tax=Trichonephila clavipes TaxID=2585209 RepID=A0A8X6VQ27_TRICX|nr:hypothetical protein TNCV_1572661 [Trichonephila clavipes]